MLHKNLNFVIEKVGLKNILYLHGWGGNKDSLKVLQSVPNATIMSLDFFSSSEYFESSYDTYQSALDVYLTLKENGIDKISIVAHSYGGRVAIILASVFGVEIENMFLIASAGINFFDIKKLLKITNFKLVKMGVKMHLLNEQVLQKYGSQDYKILDHNFKQIFKNIVRQDLRYLLDKISAKHTHLIYGNNDKITSIKICKFLNKKIINSKAYIFKSADHFAYLKYPNEILKIITENI
ncbi:MAG: alpha/beta hydrolase [Clostridia bacterium]|nr:alpha/beta hydrolase [Clostridia bacterium]